MGYDPLPLALGSVKLHLKISRALVENYGVNLRGQALPTFVFSSERTQAFMEMYKDPSWSDIAPDDGEPITCHFDRIFQRITDFQNKVVAEYKQAVGTQIKMVVASPNPMGEQGEGEESGVPEVVSHVFQNPDEKIACLRSLGKVGYYDYLRGGTVPLGFHMSQEDVLGKDEVEAVKEDKEDKEDASKVDEAAEAKKDVVENNKAEEKNPEDSADFDVQLEGEPKSTPLKKSIATPSSSSTASGETSAVAVEKDAEKEIRSGEGGLVTGAANKRTDVERA